MELELTEVQELLSSTAAKYIEEVCPLQKVRELVDTDTGLPPRYIERAGELGWFAMLVPEEQGGGGAPGEGIQNLATIAEQRGRGLQPGPFVPMNVIAYLLANRGTPQQQAEVLPAIVAGETLATWAVSDPSGAWRPGTAVCAAIDGDGYVLSGEAGLVQDAGAAQLLLVTAGGPEGLSQFLVPTATPGVTVSLRKGHDITQRMASVSFEGVRTERGSLVGTFGGAHDDVEAQLHLALVLSVAETIGAMDVLFEMARQYAIDRIAFGRPIGSFQAVKHQLADLSLSLEAGKAISVAATRALQAERTDAREIARMAKAWVGDTGIDLAQGCFQVFGGIGYTWEHDMHLFLRRITMNNLLFGQPEFHREQICHDHGI